MNTIHKTEGVTEGGKQEKKEFLKAHFIGKFTYCGVI